MSKPENSLRYYLLVGFIGILAAILTSASYLLYLRIWEETLNIAQVAEMMIKQKEDHVFVVDENQKLSGVISGIDIVRKILEISSM